MVVGVRPGPFASLPLTVRVDPTPVADCPVPLIDPPAAPGPVPLTPPVVVDPAPLAAPAPPGEGTDKESAPLRVGLPATVEPHPAVRTVAATASTPRRRSMAERFDMAARVPPRRQRISPRPV